MNLCASHDIIRLLIHIAYSLTASIFTDDRLWAPAILVIKCSCIFTTVYMNADSVRRCWYHINWVGCKVGCVDSIAILREKRKTLFFQTHIKSHVQPTVSLNFILQAALLLQTTSSGLCMSRYTQLVIVSVWCMQKLYLRKLLPGLARLRIIIAKLHPTLPHLTGLPPLGIGI